MLKSSVMFGSSGRAAVYDSNKRRIEQGGKTGTTNENRTLWFAGITPNYVTTIYIGYDNNAPITGDVSGGNGVAPLWAQYYQKLVDKGLYDTTAKFSFLENHLKNGDLVMQTLALNTGLKMDKGRAFAIRRGKLELERDDKISKGIAGVFEKAGYKSKKIENTNNNLKESNEFKEIPVKNQETISQPIKNDTKDSLFQRLLGN